MKRIISVLKKSLIGKILYFFRDLVRFPNGIFLIRNIRRSKRVAILLGVPTFNNIGDHLIAISSVKYIKDIYKDSKVIEIPTQFFLNNKSKLKEVITSETPIFIVGGGWMGSVWERDEYIMQDMIKTFSENKIIVLPQTVFYDLSINKSKKILDDAKSTYKKCKNITFFFRDENSYNFAVQEFSGQNVKVFFAPDIALYLCNGSKKKAEKKHVKLCLRNDREKNDKLDIKKILCEHFNNKFKISYTDTVTKFSIPIWMRKNVINSKIKEFGNSSLVVTDRLHGMIFCVLSNTKCIAFDNKTKKVSGVYKKWLKNNSNIIFLDENINDKKLIESVDYLLNKKEYDFSYKKDLENNFNIMKNQMSEKEGK